MIRCVMFMSEGGGRGRLDGAGGWGEGLKFLSLLRLCGR